MKIYGYVAFLPALLTTVFCANQAPPPGGPEDKTPPTVSAQFPKNGQVNVDTGVSAEVKFSEWINRASAAGAVTVYPAVPKGVTVKAVKNRLTVTPKSPLSGNTTYHISISAALQDLRGNAIARPIDIVFSTGAVLDSGRAAGVIVSLKQKAAGHKVMLFWAGWDSINNGGGWTDERYFSPPDYATQSDSAGFFSFSHIKEGRYRIAAFIDQYRVGKLRVGDTCFTSLEKVIHIVKPPQMIRLYPAESDTSTVTKKPTVDNDSVGIDTADIDAIKNKIAVGGIGIVDTAKNKLTVDIVGIIDTSEGNRAAGIAGVDTVNAPQKKLAAEKPKKLHADSLCVRLSGGADCLAPNEKRKWVYRPIIRRDTTFTVADSAGTFAFDSIPASKGTLLWFIDDNGDNLITPGRLSPWRSPERFFILPDTVEAKARWVVEGLNVRGCETPTE